MSEKVNKNALALLRDIADCRMLTLSQLAVLHFGSRRSARRRIQQVAESGFIELLPVKGNTGPGRPESVFGLGTGGYSLLQSEGVLDDAISFDQVSGRPLLSQAAHQILMNWCRIHLLHLADVLPRVKVKFLSCNSPFALDDGNGYPLVRDHVQKMSEDNPAWFTPDAAIAITDSERSLTVLFFLEVDMNTETIAGASARDICGKILRYQEYFRSCGYKRYEKLWGTELQGFRLLFVTNSPERMDSLCSAVRATLPSDFVWVTSQARLFGEGISGRIWARGGHHELGHQSILGSLSCSTPLPCLADE